MTDLGAALFLAPDGYGRLRVWQEIDGYPERPEVVGVVPASGPFREWLVARLPLREDDDS